MIKTCNSEYGFQKSKVNIQIVRNITVFYKAYFLYSLALHKLCHGYDAMMVLTGFI